MKSKKTTAERARKPLKSVSPSHEIQAKKSQSAEPNHGRILAAIAIGLALSTIVVYAQTAHYGFIAYDDLMTRWRDTGPHGRYMPNYGLAIWHPRRKTSAYDSTAAPIL